MHYKMLCCKAPSVRRATGTPQKVFSKPQFWTCFPLLAAVWGLAGCSSDSSPAPQGANPQATPLAAKVAPSSTVDKVQAWKDASKVAERKQGGIALIGGGESMNPVFGENTMLVVKPIDFEKLKAGMIVVFINRHGRRVAHVLVKKERGGWVAQGYNNQETDGELVTPQNLVGFVYANISSEVKER